MTPHELIAMHGSVSAAARAEGVTPKAIRNRRDKYDRQQNKASAFTFPRLPDKHEPIDRLLGRVVENYQRKRDYSAASTWQQIAVSSDQPIGVCLMGDPHLDDDGCNWPRLLDDIATLKQTDGLYALNVGDYSNNWVGRLARLFGNQETSQTSARQLVQWFLTAAGINWLAVVTGNHDEWNEGGEIIKLMCANATAHIPVHEWAAKLELVFPNGAKCRINAAHDFKGRSIYAANHGLKREAIWCQDGSHILVAGHIHFGEIGQCELAGGHNPWLVRVRGYKELDSYALVNGFHEGQRFPSVVAIIDPTAPEEDRVMIFGSVKQGAAVLEAMRSKKPEKCTRSKKGSKTRARPKRPRRASAPQSSPPSRSGSRSAPRRAKRSRSSS